VIKAEIVDHVFLEHAGGRSFLTPHPPTHTLGAKVGSETVDIALPAWAKLSAGFAER
jgi:hypothetical protein